MKRRAGLGLPIDLGPMGEAEELGADWSGGHGAFVQSCAVRQCHTPHRGSPFTPGRPPGPAVQALGKYFLNEQIGMSG